MSKASNYHLPVLFDEVMEGLAIRPQGIYLDGTCGGGGHSSGILARLSEGGCLISLDRDPMALAYSETILEAVESPAKHVLCHAEFSDFERVLDEQGVAKVDGVLLDLGVSSAQLDRPERGFSYQDDGPLDMRMNRDKGESAADYLARVEESELYRVLRDYGEERYAGRIARAICARRAERPITHSADLADVIRQAMPGAARREKQHPAKRSFQAIRIAVNDELGELERFLIRIPERVAPGGRICIISFHSLEDRPVKEAMRHWEDPCECPKEFPCCVCGKKPLGRRVDKKGLTADAKELNDNPRSRSARLRIFEMMPTAAGEQERREGL